MKLFRTRQWQILSGLGLSLSLIVGFSQTANAADILVISYGPLNATLAISDLETLAQTGEVSDSLQFYLNLAGLEPTMLRDLLKLELSANSKFIEDLLASNSGNQLLAELSEVIHLPPNRPDIQVLKSADPQQYREPSASENQTALKQSLIKAADDRQITILEVLQNYPTERVYLDAAKLIELANSLQPESEQPR
ncbi:MAG: alpha/beta hydrolase [Elainella sp.]